MRVHSFRTIAVVCAASLLAGCTLFLIKSDTQCATDGDCLARFPNSSSSCSAGTCVTTNINGGGGGNEGGTCIANSDCNNAAASGTTDFLCVQGSCVAANNANCQVLNRSLLTTVGAQPTVIGLLSPSGVSGNGVFTNPTSAIQGAVLAAANVFNAAASETGAAADVRQAIVVQCDEAQPASLSHLITDLGASGIVGPLDDARALAYANTASTLGKNNRGIPVFSPFANAETVAGTSLWSAAPNRSVVEPVFSTLLAAAKAYFATVQSGYAYNPVTVVGDSNDIGSVELFAALKSNGALPASPSASLPDILYTPTSTLKTALQYGVTAQAVTTAVPSQPTVISLESGMLDSFEVLYDVENAFKSSALLPFYLPFQLSTSFLTDVALDNPNTTPRPYARTLVIDFVRPAASMAIEQALASQTGTSFEWGAEYAYDSFLTMAYALYAARDQGKNSPETVTLAQFSFGMQAITQGSTTACTSNGSNGTSCPIDGSALDILRTLSVGGKVQITGASGALDYTDPTGKLSITKSPKGQVALYCITYTSDANNPVRYTDSGYHLSAAAGSADGGVTAQGTICCPGVNGKTTCP